MTRGRTGFSRPNWPSSSWALLRIRSFILPTNGFSCTKSGSLNGRGTSCLPWYSSMLFSFRRCTEGVIVLLAVFGLLLPFLFTFQNRYKWGRLDRQFELSAIYRPHAHSEHRDYFAKPVNVMEKKGQCCFDRISGTLICDGFKPACCRTVETVRARLKAIKQSSPAPRK